MHKWGLLLIVCLSSGALANSLVPADGILSLIQQAEPEGGAVQTDEEELEGISSSLFFDEPQTELDPEGNKLKTLDKEPEDLFEDDFLSGALGELDSLESTDLGEFSDTLDSSNSIDSLDSTTKEEPLLMSTNPLETLF